MAFSLQYKEYWSDNQGSIGRRRSHRLGWVSGILIISGISGRRKGVMKSRTERTSSSCGGLYIIANTIIVRTVRFAVIWDRMKVKNNNFIRNGAEHISINFQMDDGCKLSIIGGSLMTLIAVIFIGIVHIRVLTRTPSPFPCFEVGRTLKLFKFLELVQANANVEKSWKMWMNFEKWKCRFMKNWKTYLFGIRYESTWYHLSHLCHVTYYMYMTDKYTAL